MNIQARGKKKKKKKEEKEKKKKKKRRKVLHIQEKSKKGEKKKKKRREKSGNELEIHAHQETTTSQLARDPLLRGGGGLYSIPFQYPQEFGHERFQVEYHFL